MKHSRPRIAITARFHPDTRSYRVGEEYVEAIVRSNGQPYIVPFTESTVPDDLLSNVDGLLLTGGEDIDPAFCGNTPRLDDYPYYPLRDQFELSLAECALRRGLTTLGICRGCQILYVATAGKLIADIPTAVGTQVLHRISRTATSLHSVALESGSKVRQAYQQAAVTITSYHHQGLLVDNASRGTWQVSATSEDGLAEAIELIGPAWIVGVLWHPELPMDRSGGTSDKLIAEFVARAGGSDV